MNYFEESDQAGIINDIYYSHLMNGRHINNKPDSKCLFCKHFILTIPTEGKPLESYSYILLDISKTK